MTVKVTPLDVEIVLVDGIDHTATWIHLSSFVSWIVAIFPQNPAFPRAILVEGCVFSTSLVMITILIVFNSMILLITFVE